MDRAEEVSLGILAVEDLLLDILAGRCCRVSGVGADIDYDSFAAGFFYLFYLLVLLFLFFLLLQLFFILADLFLTLCAADIVFFGCVHNAGRL